MMKKIVFLVLSFIYTTAFASNSLYRFQIHFDTGSYHIKKEDMSSLQDFASYLQNHPSVSAEIQGHTDSVGNAEDNKKLSQLRANAVADVLISYGVSPDQLQAIGYGEEVPIASNDTEDGRYQNRRVEAHLKGLKAETNLNTLTGKIVDANTGAPLSVATVELFTADSLVTFTTTDANGDFTLHVKPGTYLMTVSREGFLPKSQEVTVDKNKKVLAPFYLPSKMAQLTAPKVTFEKSSLKTDKSKTKITLNVKDQGSGIGKITFYNNGVEINPVLLSSRKEGQKIVYTYLIGTPVGKSQITAIAYDKSNTVQSMPAQMEIVANYEAKPVLHTVIIGIDRFDNPRLNLNFTDDDARLMKQVLRQYSTKLFDDVEVTYLVGQPNTIKKQIVQKLKEMKNRVNPNDYFVFYVSSHGYFDTRHNKYYLVPSDASDKAHMISEDELKNLMADIDTRYKLILFDTCHSGKVTESIAKKLMQKKNTDVTTISASKTQQVAMEGYKGHGIFTYILAEGLRGGADVNQNKRVDSIEIAHYIQKYLPTLSVQRFHKRQDAVVNYTPRSFDITLLDERYKPEQIVPVEFKKEELPQLIHSMDTQNVTALNSFYAQHEVDNAIKPETVPQKHKTPKKKKRKPSNEKPSKFNVGIGAMYGYGYGFEVFAEYRPHDLFSLYVTGGKNFDRIIVRDSLDADTGLKSGDVTTVGVQVRLAFLLYGIEYVISEDSSPNIRKKSKYSTSVGFGGSGKHWDGGFIIKKYDDEGLTKKDYSMSGGFFVRYKFF